MAGMVIIGCGQAGGQAAASLRQEKYEGPITMIGQEPYIPYQRPPLSKQYLSGEQEKEKLSLRQESFYSEKEINLMLETSVLSLDPHKKELQLEKGETVTYDKLLIATGGRPRKLEVDGHTLKGIHYLRNIDDVDAIKTQMSISQNLVIVGGGYIGLEVASVAIKKGLTVSILEMESRILERVTTEEMSTFYHQLHTDEGVNIFTSTQAKAFKGSETVESVACGDHEIPADLVIVGIGILPNTEMAEAAGLETNNGLVVDEHCRTSNEHIFAAGDCTNHPNPILNRRLRLESVPNAMEQGRVAASNMLGGSKSYASMPWFWSDQYEHKLQMVGFSKDSDQSVVRGDMASKSFTVFYLKDDSIIAADSVNNPKEFMASKQLVGKKASIEALADTSIELKTLIN
tara:strand:+ start:4226 stop:5431 length:1206 start_codon:yes stop_codon:yes gene_type:complete